MEFAVQVNDRQVVKEIGFGSWSERAIWSAVDAPRRPRRADVTSPASHWCLVSIRHVSLVRLHTAISRILNSRSNDAEYQLSTATVAN
jgi:hypothetical protein